jgi:peptidoglycan/LPS O-acetylase OafA/YrhL
MAITTIGKPPGNSLSHRPDIDGLRALAVLPVLLFHAKLGCTGGFVGVDVFFVISGFLISSLILHELEAGTFSLWNFWERRIRRILPALFVVVLATVVAGWFLFLPEDFERLGKSIIAQAALASNIYFHQQGLTEGGYFATTADTKTLLHTWSLAVEEQFYLFFPILVMVLVRAKKSLLLPAIIGLAIASFGLSVYGSYTSPSATFYLLPTRAWELLLGALLAARRGRSFGGRLVNEIFGWAGVGLILAAVFCYNSSTRFPGLAAVLPCFGAVLIILSSESKLSSAGRMLAFGPVVFIGLISYSLYLWHWPLLVFSKYYYEYRNMAGGEPGAGFRAAVLLASGALAVLSWKYVETPVRKRRIFQTRPQIYGFGGAAMLALFLCGLVLFQSGGVPARFHGRALSYVKTRSHRAFLNETTLEQAKAGQFFEIGVHDPGRPISLLIWGDSHAMSVTPVLDELCHRFSWRGVQAACSATAPILEYTDTNKFGMGEKTPVFAQAVLAFIAQKQVRNVVLAARWSSYLTTDSARRELQETVRAITNSGARAFVLKDVPWQDRDLTRLVSVAVLHDGDLEPVGVSRQSYQAANVELNQTFAQLSEMGATVLDPADYFLNNKGLYGIVKNNQVLYWDYHHLTVEGAEVLAPLFEPMFQTK